AAPLTFLLWQPSGSGQPAWRIFWHLFGTSNQLLAALTLLGVTGWLWRTRRAWWARPVVGVPPLFMYVSSLWALLRVLNQPGDLATPQPPTSPVPYAAVVRAGLRGSLLVGAGGVLLRSRPVGPAPAPAQLGAEDGCRGPKLPRRVR